MTRPLQPILHQTRPLITMIIHSKGLPQFRQRWSQPAWPPIQASINSTLNRTLSNKKDLQVLTTDSTIIIKLPWSVASLKAFSVNNLKTTNARLKSVWCKSVKMSSKNRSGNVMKQDSKTPFANAANYPPSPSIPTNPCLMSKRPGIHLANLPLKCNNNSNSNKCRIQMPMVVSLHSSLLMRPIITTNRRFRDTIRIRIKQQLITHRLKLKLIFRRWRLELELRRIVWITNLRETEMCFLAVMRNKWLLASAKCNREKCKKL